MVNELLINESQPIRKKTLVIYHYYEKDQIYIDNFLHFLKFGYSDVHDYVIVTAGKCSIALPQKKNIRYVFAKNKNNDYGGYCAVINSGIAVLPYDFFVFINSSVRGPYLPAYCKKDWTEYFTDLLVADVGIVGSTINILSKQSLHSILYRERHGDDTWSCSHVQTMSYALSQAALLYLIESGFYDAKDALEKDIVICDYEIRLSQMLIKRGWNIKCLLPEYNLIDYRQAHCETNPTSSKGDPGFKCTYFGRTVHPFEVVFIKTNRSLVSLEYLDRLSYSCYSGQLARDVPLASDIFFEKTPAFLRPPMSARQVSFDVVHQRRLRAVIAQFIPKPIKMTIKYLIGVMNKIFLYGNG